MSETLPISPAEAKQPFGRQEALPEVATAVGPITVTIEQGDDWVNRRLAMQAEEQAAAEARKNTPILPEAPAEVAELLRPDRRIENFADLHEVASALVGEPLINGDIMHEHTVEFGEGWDMQRDVTVPMSRIVGIQTFATWAGRGFMDNGKLPGKNGGSSLAEVAKCASLGQIDKYLGPGGAPTLQLFEDISGGVWAIVTIEGSHRVAGARARGDELLYHADVAVAERLPKVDFAVADMLTSMKQSGEIDRYDMTPDQYAEMYVEASMELEAAKVERQKKNEAHAQSVHRAPEAVPEAGEDDWLDGWV